MSSLTPNKNLFKWNPSTDGSQQFDINKALNENWDKIDAEKVGGRNYILNSENVVAEITNGGSKTIPFNISSAFNDENAIENLKGKEITISYYYNAEDVCKDTTTNTPRYGMGLTFGYDSAVKYIGVWRYISSGNGKGRAYVTASLPDDWNGFVGQTNLYIRNFGTGTKIKIYNPKIEIGNQVTDWTPAPEDKADVSYVDTELSTKLNNNWAKKTLSSAGWYRIAEIKEYGTFLLQIWNTWNATAPQISTLIVNYSRDADCEIINLSATAIRTFGKVRIIKKVIDSKSKYFLDVYYSASSRNEMKVNILDGQNQCEVMAFEDIDDGTNQNLICEKNISAYNINTRFSLFDGQNLRTTALSSYKTFDEIFNLGLSSVFMIDGNNIQTKNGFPTGAYNYGLLITLIATQDYAKTQIYIPDRPYLDSQRGIYVRTRPGSSWLKLAGTEVASVVES